MLLPLPESPPNKKDGRNRTSRPPYRPRVFGLIPEPLSVMVPETVTATDLPLGGHSDDGLAETEMAGDVVSMPVPERLMDCGLLAALSVMEMEPVCAPKPARPTGLKVTLMVQLPSGATMAPVQLSVSRKSLALVPPIVTVEKLSVAAPLFVTVTVCGSARAANLLIAKIQAIGRKVDGERREDPKCR